MKIFAGEKLKKDASIVATYPARDGDLDGFFKVEETKQMKVVLCVLPNALPLTLEKVQEILAHFVQGKFYLIFIR